MRLAARSTVIAGVLSIAAILVPAASARLNLEPVTTVQGQPTTSGPVVRPNPHQQISQSTPVGPPILRVARASELAAINRAEAQARAALAYSASAGARYSSAGTDAYAAFAHPVAASAPTVPGAGFDYGAAAVGAGLAVAIIVLIGAGGLALRRRRQPQFG